MYLYILLLCRYICYCTLGILHYTGLATVECANINACSSSVSENKGTMELVNIRQRAQNLLCDVVQNGSQ